MAHTFLKRGERFDFFFRRMDLPRNWRKACGLWFGVAVNLEGVIGPSDVVPVCPQPHRRTIKIERTGKLTMDRILKPLAQYRVQLCSHFIDLVKKKPIELLEKQKHSLPAKYL